MHPVLTSLFSLFPAASYLALLRARSNTTCIPTPDTNCVSKAEGKGNVEEKNSKARLVLRTPYSVQIPCGFILSRLVSSRLISPPRRVAARLSRAASNSACHATASSTYMIRSTPYGYKTCGRSIVRPWRHPRIICTCISTDYRVRIQSLDGCLSRSESGSLVRRSTVDRD